METSIREQSGVSVVSLTDSVDMADSEALQSLFDLLIEQGKTRVVVDLAEMDFVCSMGLGVLVHTYTTLRGLGGYLRLVRPQLLIVKLIKTTGLDRLLPIYDTLDEALA